MKSAKARILYIEAAGKVRANDWSTMVILSPQPSRNRERTATWLDSLGRSANTFAIGLNASEPAAAMPRHRFVCSLGFVSHLKNSLSIASCGARRPETFPKTAIYCHLLPFWSRKTATPVSTVSFLPCPRGHAGQPGPRAENRERGQEEPRWKVATECRLSHDRSGWQYVVGSFGKTETGWDEASTPSPGSSPRSEARATTWLWEGPRSRE